MKRIQLILLLLVISQSGEAAAQMFGQRDLGRPLNRNSRPGTQGSAFGNAAAVGTIDASRRFLREARSADDFVGALGQAGFVGGTSSATTATSSVSGLIEEARPPLNRPRIVRSTGLYPERLSLTPSALATSGGSPQSEQQPSLPAAGDVSWSPALQSITSRYGVSIEVSQVAGVATLRGEVPSAHDRRMIGLLATFEPAFQRVENDLTVTGAKPPGPQPDSESDSQQ